MLKKIASPIFVVVLTLLVSACSETAEPKLNRQYSLLNNDLSNMDLAPITEVFALTCGHCRNMEASIPEIEKQTGQKVGKVHVTFNESAQVSAMLYYAMEMQLGSQPDHDLIESLFEVVQSQEGTSQDKQSQIATIFTSNDLISPYRFEQSHIAELEKYMAFANTVTQQAEINSVPSFIVKGKYLLLTEGHEDIEDLSNTINFLLSKPE
jgi:predicted DsbA family dithiol-disulfide isomerase